jgi:hypothetical protein
MHCAARSYQLHLTAKGRRHDGRDQLLRVLGKLTDIK